MLLVSCSSPCFFCSHHTWWSFNSQGPQFPHILQLLHSTRCLSNQHGDWTSAANFLNGNLRLYRCFQKLVLTQVLLREKEQEARDQKERGGMIVRSESYCYKTCENFKEQNVNNWLIFEPEIRKMMISLPFKKMIWGYESSTGTEIWNLPGLPPESIILVHNLEYFTPLKRQTCISTWYGRILQGPVICHCSHIKCCLVADRPIRNWN